MDSVTGEYYTRNEKELIPFQPPLPNIPHKEDQSHVTTNSLANENPSQIGIQKEKEKELSESPAPIVSHMTSFQFAPTPSVSTTHAPTMEIKFGDISSIPIQISREKEVISDDNKKNKNSTTLSTDESNTTNRLQENMDEKEERMKKKTENQLYSKQVIEMDVKTRSKKRRMPNKPIKAIPSLAQIERVTGKTKKGLPACFVRGRRTNR